MRGSNAHVSRAGLTAGIVSQFRQPTGTAGRLAGWIMASRPSNRMRNARDIASGKVTLRIGNVLDSEAELPRFDKIYSVNVVQFWPDPRRVFARLEELLKPRGAIATTYMPRVGSNKDGQAAAKAEELTMLLREIGFGHIETHWLIDRPTPAFCVVATSAVD